VRAFGSTRIEPNALSVSISNHIYLIVPRSVILSIRHLSGAPDRRRTEPRLTSTGTTAHSPETRGPSATDAFLQALANQASVGIFLTDSCGNCLYLNDRLYALTGLPRSGASGQGWLTALHPDDQGHLIAEWTKATAEGRTFLTECRFQRPDATVRWVTVEAFPLKTGGMDVTGYVGTVRDMTARKHALEALQASEERYRNLIQASPQPVLVSSGGVIVFTNPAGAHLFGAASPRELIGQPITNWLSTDLLHAAYATEEAEGGAVAPCEARLVRPDGTTVEIELTAAPITFDGTSALQLILSDLTAQKESAARQHHANKMEAIATLSGGIAHEFNNCLTAILGFTELTLPAIPPDSKPYGHLQQVIVASKRARDLVHQMLVFSRQAGSTKQPMALHWLLKETLRVLRIGLPDHITLREWIHGPTRPVLADPTQIHQLFVNLLANAEQAMSTTGGVLEVRLDDVRLGPSATGSTPQLPSGDYVRLTVSDGGEGMSSGVQARMFDPFFTTKGIGEGIGMGLAVVHGIVTEHGGTIRVTSQLGHGTTVEVYLPSLPDEPPPPTHPSIER